MTELRRVPRPVPIVALDFGEIDSAMQLVYELGDLCRFYKVGSELFTEAGPAAVRKLRDAGCEVMLDMKFHDIPNTVRGAVRSARQLGARLLTVHASGGELMMRAAVEEAGQGTDIFAVTVLTSFDDAGLGEAWGRANIEVSSEVVRLATLAHRAGARGVVASGTELAAIRAALGSTLEVLVPGVRPAGAEHGDQARVVTPTAAVKGGADYMILGRAITRAADPRASMASVIKEIIGE